MSEFDYGRSLDIAFPERRDWVLGRILERRAQTDPDTVFLKWCQLEELTFREVNARANRYAHGLAELGVQRGDKMALFLPNCLEYVLIWFALCKLGAVEVPVNVHYRRGFLEHALNVSGARWVVTDERLLNALAQCGTSALSGVRGVLVRDAGNVPSWHGVQLQLPPLVPLSAVRHRDDRDPDVSVSYTDPAAVLFTSGTTGRAKAVQMSHSQMYFFAQQCVDLVQLAEGDVYLNPYPMYHGNSQFLTIYPSLIAGSTAVLMERFSASRWSAWVRDNKVTVVNLLGVSMEYILNQPQAPDESFTSLRTVYAVPRSDALLPAWRHRFGRQHFVTSFGQTETGWPLMGPRDEFPPPGAVGKVVSEWYDVRLVDPETDEEVEVGQVGELVVRSKMPFTMCDGYLRGDTLDFGPVRNLWWHTGDGLRRDDQGWFYFVDRTNDAMRVRGENVSSFEVEQAVLTYPGVVECAAVGVPSEVAGGEHDIEIVVVMRDPELFSPADLIRHCNQRAPWFAVPRYVRLVDVLPKTPNEKVIKTQLREASLTAGEVWDRVAAGVALDRS